MIARPSSKEESTASGFQCDTDTLSKSLDEIERNGRKDFNPRASSTISRTPCDGVAWSQVIPFLDLTHMCPFGSSGSCRPSFKGGSYRCQRIIRSKVFVGEPQVFDSGVFFLNVVFMVRIQVTEVWWYGIGWLKEGYQRWNLCETAYEQLARDISLMQKT